MPSQTPLVSIVLPVHNGFPYLPRAVESVLRQQEQRWQLIVINDGSTDRTRSYLNEITDQRVKVLHQANAGLSAALNRGLEHVDTPFVARMDADDISYPDRIGEQLQHLVANPQVGLLGTQIHRMGECRTDGGSRLPLAHQPIMATLLRGDHAICHPTIMCRREAFDATGGYKAGLGEEWEMFFRIGEQWKLANLPKCLLAYRYHAGSINGSRMAELRRRIRYQCVVKQQRTDGVEPSSYEDFLQAEASLPWSHRTLRRLEDAARTLYHQGVADTLGRHRLRGYARLGVAALGAPQLTFGRLQRRLLGAA